MRLFMVAAFIVGCMAWPGAAGAGDIVSVGAGSYTTQLPPGAKAPQDQIWRTASVTGKMPTNRWWSSAAWIKYSDDQYPHPLAVQAVAEGLRISYPGAAITASGGGVFGSMPAKGGQDMILGHSKVDSFPDARVDGFSDWFVRLRWGDSAGGMTISYGHGSPFIYAMYEGGSAKISFAAAPKIWSGDAHSAVVGLSVGSRHYGLFAPTGSTWSGWGTAQLTCDTPPAKGYFTIALLSDDKPATLALFKRYAYDHVIDTRFSWKYDQAASSLTTTFTYTTRAYEGDERGTLFALYPHHWRHLAGAKLLGPEYASVRGTMKLASGTSFATVMRFGGVLPALPRTAGADASKMSVYLEEEQGKMPLRDFGDTYGEGKWLGKQANLSAIAGQYEAPDQARQIGEPLRQRLEQWFTASRPDGAVKRKGLFYYDQTWGTLIGYPAGYGSDTALNDHHFHYGYFIRAAAEIARLHPDWAKDAQWGGMVKMLIRDIANPDRNDAMFPFMRTFDPYAGHSWASGNATFADGNNQESSSEAMNAWYGLILWGEATGDRSLRDLGIMLYTNESAAIDEYWFDVTGQNYPAAYTRPVMGMIWGGKGVYATWFSGEPEAIYGINWLPIHGGSLYLGAEAAFCQRSYAGLLAARKGDNWKMWPDLIWMYRALSDPDDAMRQFDAGVDRHAPEGGNSRANTYQWIAAFKTMGHVDASVWADEPLAAAFVKGSVRTHVAYNNSAAQRMVKFSDGFELAVRPGSFAIGTSGSGGAGK